MPRTGRPIELNKVVREDGRTAADMTVEDAVATANITKPTYYLWKRTGAQAQAKAAAGTRLTKKERDTAEFLDRLEKAQAEFELTCLSVIHRAGEGGFKQTKTTTRTLRRANGSVTTEVTTVESTTAPQWTAKAWLLERRRPDTYRRRMELSGPDGRDLIPREERASSIADALEEHLRAEAESAKVEDQALNPSKTT
jgi:hypothetical protein